jgi:hypothetical protein
LGETMAEDDEEEAEEEAGELVVEMEPSLLESS